MSEQQITVDDLMRQVSCCESAARPPTTDSLRKLHHEKMHTMLEQFAAQQRADATQQLQRENAELQHKYDDALVRGVSVAGKAIVLRDEVVRLRAELAAAKQQLAEAEKDAERYRWLRDQHKKHLGLTICKVGMWDLTPWSGDDPDAAIDAAIASESARDATGCPHLRRATHKSIIDGSVERDRCADCGEVLSIGVASAIQSGEVKS